MQYKFFRKNFIFLLDFSTGCLTITVKRHPFSQTHVDAAGCPFTWWLGIQVPYIFWKKLKFLLRQGQDQDHLKTRLSQYMVLTPTTKEIHKISPSLLQKSKCSCIPDHHMLRQQLFKKRCVSLFTVILRHPVVHLEPQCAPCAAVCLLACSLQWSNMYPLWPLNSQRGPSIKARYTPNKTYIICSPRKRTSRFWNVHKRKGVS